MKKNYIIVITIALLVIVGLVLQQNRYYLQAIGNGAAYKIDRWTGKTWLVSNGIEKEVSTPEQPKEKSAEELRQEEIEWGNSSAIIAAKLSHVSDKYKTTDQWLNEHIKNLKGDLIIYGWKAEHKGSDVYLVSFSYTHNGQNYIDYFEVMKNTNIVRLVAGDKELEKKYGIVYAKK